MDKADLLGALASGLCMVHCLATPFLFIAAACTDSCCASAPAWWRWIDVLFLVISFFAVYRSASRSDHTGWKLGLWISWVALFVFVSNEQLGILPVAHYFKYTAACSLIAFHLINLRHCRCQAKRCAVSPRQNPVNPVAP